VLRPELNVYCVLKERGKYLVLKRKNGIWEFPGGGIEKGESAEEACEREAFEECGLRVRAGRMLCTTSAAFGRKYALYAVYECRRKGGKARISGEHSEMKWASLKEMRGMGFGFNARPVLDII